MSLPIDPGAAWRAYVRANERSRGIKLDPDWKRAMRRAFMASWRARERAEPVLAKDAIALVIEHEWSGWEDWVGDEGLITCAECGGVKPGQDRMRLADEARVGHRSGCKWGAICEASRRLG